MISKYKDRVLPFFDEILEWRTQGLTEKEICKRLGVPIATWDRYKNKHEELKELIKEFCV